MSLRSSFTRAPGVATAAALTFALVTAIVAVTSALVWHVLVRQLPFPEAERLVFVWNRYGAKDVSSAAMSAPDFGDRRNARSFETTAAWRPDNVNLNERTPERLAAARVTDGFFDVLRVTPQLGQPFARGEDDAVLISDRLWRRLFGANRGIVGTTVRIDGKARRVAGVMAPGFALMRPDIDVWIPLQLEPGDFADENRGNENLVMIARLKDGVSQSAAQAEMNVITASVFERVPDRVSFLRETRWHVDVFGIRDDLVRRYRSSLWILFACGILVLILGASNVAGLFVARTVSRQKELAVRVALGASRFRVVWEITSEILTLALAGAAAGLPLAFAAIPYAAASGIPRAEELRIGVEVAVFAVVASVAAALLIGTGISAWVWKSRQVDGTRGGTATRAATRVRALLVAAQIAVALTLLASGTLLVESYRRLREVEIGFDPSRLVTYQIALPRNLYKPPQRRAFFASLQERLAALPGVAATSGVSSLPFSESDWTATFDVEGRDPALPQPSAHWRVVMPRYFQTMKVAFQSGRTFGSGDVDGAQLVCVIDEPAAKAYWPGSNPVGRRLKFGDRDFVVIGIAGGVRDGSLATSAEPHVYLSVAQSRESEMAGVVRTDLDPAAVAAAVRGIVRSLDPSLPVFSISTMEEAIDRSAAQPRLRAALVGGFAVAGTALALIGLAGLLAYVVSSRTREMGVRVALGATPAGLARLVAQRSLAISAAGLVAGLAGAFAMTRTMRNLFYGVETLQLRVCFGAALLFLVVAMLSSLAPAVRAARIDPASALRQE